MSFWEIVGGEATGGLLVREEYSSTSKELGRLSTGSTVLQLKTNENRLGTINENRLRYRLVDGSGPKSGWITTELKKKTLAQKIPDPEHQLTGTDYEAVFEVEKPSKLFSGVLPATPRSDKVPGPDQLEAKDALRFEKRNGPFKMYLFIFYGAGDYASTWFEFANAMPEWLDVAIFERAGHGVRKSENFLNHFESARDALGVFRTTLEKVAKGGVYEGAPFALLGHSAGSDTMAEFARLAHVQFGVDPRCICQLDNPPPTAKTMSAWGRKLLLEKPQEWMDIWNPGLAEEMREGKEGTWKSLLHDHIAQLDFHGPHWQHRFHCDMFCWTTMQGHNVQQGYVAAKARGALFLSPEYSGKAYDVWWKRNQLYETGATQDYLWDYTLEQFEQGWTSLADGSSRCFRVETEHNKMNFDTAIMQDVSELLYKYVRTPSTSEKQSKVTSSSEA